VQRNTLLAEMWHVRGDSEVIISRLESGDLILTGNFRGREQEIASQARNEEASPPGESGPPRGDCRLPARSRVRKSRRFNPVRAAWIREEMRQTGCLAIEAADRWDRGER
jgi:hypothetical protein